MLKSPRAQERARAKPKGSYPYEMIQEFLTIATCGHGKYMKIYENNYNVKSSEIIHKIYLILVPLLYLKPTLAEPQKAPFSLFLEIVSHIVHTRQASTHTHTQFQTPVMEQVTDDEAPPPSQTCLDIERRHFETQQIREPGTHGNPHRVSQW